MLKVEWGGLDYLNGCVMDFFCERKYLVDQDNDYDNLVNDVYMFLTSSLCGVEGK